MMATIYTSDVGDSPCSLPRNPRKLYPLLTCPTWVLENFPSPQHYYVPHGKRQRLSSLNFTPGGALERNIGFSDGHVEYARRQIP